MKQTSFDESSNCGSLSSEKAKSKSDSSQLLTTSAEVNFNNLTTPTALSRKPSISFNETVFVFRSERRNSSPGISFGSSNKKNYFTGTFLPGSSCSETEVKQFGIGKSQSHVNIKNT